MDETHRYGIKINYRERQVIRLPDLSIRFIGQRHESSPVFRHGFTFYDFEVTKGDERKTVSWSSGTGDIGPTYFEIGGERFVLELRASAMHEGFLAEGEMVIWRRDEYERLLNNRR